MMKGIKSVKLNSIEYFGYITYFILAILSLVFYLERTVFLDIAFHLFYILKDGDFTIQNNRFVAFITQSFPLIGYKLGLGLKTIMKLYSIGFILFYASIFAIIVRVFKSYKYGLIMLLFSILMISHTFYWIQSELPQGIAFVILYFGFLDYISKRFENNDDIFRYLPIIFVLLFIIAFSHPLIIFPFFFISFYFIVNNAANKKIYLSSLYSFLGLYFFKTIFFKTDYDSGAMAGLRNFITLFPDYFSIQSNKNFIHYIISDYYLLIISLIFILVWLIRKKEFLKLILIIFFFFGYLLLVNVSNPNGAEQFYIENLYLPLSVFVIVPLVFDFFDKINNKTSLMLLTLLIITGLFNMFFTHKPYSNRIDYLEDYIEKTNTIKYKKQIIDEDRMSKDTLMMSWATPYEFWLLSTIKTGKTLSIMVTDNIREIEWGVNYKTKFLTKWGAFDYSELPDKYFRLKDTSKYVIIK